MISEDEARSIARAYLERAPNGFTFNFVATPQRHATDWSIVFDWVSPEGDVFDGPIVVLVDKQTGRARTLEQAIEERSKGV